MGGNDEWFLERFYDEYPLIEEEFGRALDESLQPRGPDYLYDIVGGMGLGSDASVLDAGCGEGKNIIEVARRFGWRACGVDPSRGHVASCRNRLNDAASEEPALGERVRFVRGRIESLPLRDASFDLIWCKEVLVHIDELERAFGECRRVLRPGGRMMIYQVFAGARMEPGEARSFWDSGGVIRKGTEAANIERAFVTAGFREHERIELTSEGGEFGEEREGQVTRRLLHAARLLRDPERYIARFGRPAYEIMFNDCLWHIYRMIGKLSARVYVLARD